MKASSAYSPFCGQILALLCPTLLLCTFFPQLTASILPYTSMATPASLRRMENFHTSYYYWANKSFYSCTTDGKKWRF